MSVVILIYVSENISFASNSVSKNEVMSVIEGLSYVDTYYLGDFGDQNVAYECYLSEKNETAYPMYVFFYKNNLVNDGSRLDKLSKIAIANNYLDYYADIIPSMEAVNDGLDSAIIARVANKAGTFSASIASKLLGSYLGQGQILTDTVKTTLISILKDVTSNWRLFSGSK